MVCHKHGIFRSSRSTVSRVLTPLPLSTIAVDTRRDRQVVTEPDSCLARDVARLHAGCLTNGNYTTTTERGLRTTSHMRGCPAGWNTRPLETARDHCALVQLQGHATYDALMDIGLTSDRPNTH